MGRMELKMNNGVTIPQVGFGVFQVAPEQTRDSVLEALNAGYRHIDTAKLYANEAEVAQAIGESGLPRDEVFVTTKLWNDDQGYDRALRAFDASMDRLGFDVLDLYLIHWPTPRADRYADTWRAFEKLYAEGRVRAIGVSNFTPEHLRRLLDSAEVAPAINQVELHPYLQQAELRAAHDELGILTEAWSPIARGGDVLVDPVVVGIAEKHRRTTAQVILRWHLQIGNVVLPRSVNPTRIRENISLFDFELDEEDLAAIADLDGGGRIGPDPARFG
jgi:2,5-diketo-D-gluconate reductase A